MNYCPNCQLLEGEVVSVPTMRYLRQISDDGKIRLQEIESEMTTCAHCGEEISRIPEHDDHDMER